MFSPAYDTEAAAQFLGYARKTLYNLRSQGRGPKFVRVNGRIRYRFYDLQNWVREQTEDHE